MTTTPTGTEAHTEAHDVDWAAVREDFPILRREIDGAPIVYLDSGNTSQKPRQVLEAMDEFQRTSYAPINRSAYRLAAEATDRYEGARAAVARFVNAPSSDEVVFTKNATESLNLITTSWGGANLRASDAVVLTHMEHHANIVPWHMLAERLDIDALRIVAQGIREVRADRPGMGVVLITHYQRLLDEIVPDHIHILVDGRIVQSGGMELAEQLERDGYDAFRATA